MTEEQYFESKQQNMLFKDMWTKPLYECPKCKKMSVCRNDGIIYTSFPQKNRYQCLARYDGCGEYNAVK